MARIAGKYVSGKSENLENFLADSGLTSEVIARVSKSGSVSEWTVEGNRYNFVSDTGIKLSFALNEEFDEPLATGTKNVAALNGNVLTVTSKLSDGRALVRDYHFTDDGFTAILHLNGNTAKRFYTRI